MPEETKQPPLPSQTHSDALLQAAIERLKARGGSTRQMACMQLPAPLFNDLCARLMDRATPVLATAEWLAGQTADAPTKSSVDRFAQALFEEYRLAQLAQTRQAAASYVAQATDGDPDAMQMALNSRLTELLTDCMLRTDSLDEVDTDRIFALSGAAKAVAQVTMAKQMKDTRVKALEKLIEDKDATIKLKDQKYQEQDRKIQAAVTAAERAAAGAKGEKGAGAVVDAIKEALGLKGAA